MTARNASRAVVAARPALLAVVLGAALQGCSGDGCDRLAALTRERDAARAAYSDLLARGGATTEQTERADADTHALDEQVYALEQACG